MPEHLVMWAFCFGARVFGDKNLGAKDYERATIPEMKSGTHEKAIEAEIVRFEERPGTAERRHHGGAVSPLFA